MVSVERDRGRHRAVGAVLVPGARNGGEVETVWAGTAFRHAATSAALPHPAAAAKSSPMRSASASVGSRDLQSWSSRSSDPPGLGASATPKSVLYCPLVLTALWNRPAAVGEAI